MTIAIVDSQLNLEDLPIEKSDKLIQLRISKPFTKEAIIPHFQ